MACALMHFYSMSYPEMLELPMPLFWEMCKNIDRIRAEKDRRLFIAMAASRGNRPGEYLRKLDQEQGTVIETEVVAEFDKGGFKRLKKLVGRRN